MQVQMTPQTELITNVTADKRYSRKGRDVPWTEQVTSKTKKKKTSIRLRWQTCMHRLRQFFNYMNFGHLGCLAEKKKKIKQAGTPHPISSCAS